MHLPRPWNSCKEICRYTRYYIRSWVTLRDNWKF